MKYTHSKKTRLSARRAEIKQAKEASYIESVSLKEAPSSVPILIKALGYYLGSVTSLVIPKVTDSHRGGGRTNSVSKYSSKSSAECHCPSTPIT
jgi:hypothetical protein